MILTGACLATTGACIARKLKASQLKFTASSGFILFLFFYLYIVTVACVVGNWHARSDPARPHPAWPAIRSANSL